MKRVTVLLATLLLSCLSFSFQTKEYKALTTENFKIRYEHGVPASLVTSISKLLEQAYRSYHEELGLSYGGKITATIYTSVGRYKAASGSKYFSNGDYHAGSIFLVYDRETRPDYEKITARVVCRSLLDRIALCPPWYAEAYSLSVAGQDLDQYGKPARANMGGLTDLSEDYLRSESAKDVRELYAKLAMTIGFLIDKYGDGAVRAAFPRFQAGDTIEETFERVFKDKYVAIEQDWLKQLHTSAR